VVRVETFFKLTVVINNQIKSFEEYTSSVSGLVDLCPKEWNIAS